MMEQDAGWVKARLGALLLGIGLGLFVPAAAFGASAKLPDGLWVEGQSLAGLTTEEAVKKTEDRIAVMAGQTITLEINERVLTATAEELGFYWGNPQDVRQAVSRYEDGNLVRRYMMAADLAAEPLEISLKTALQEEVICAFVEENCAGMDADAQDAGIVRVNGAFQITPEVMGIRVNVEATAQAVREAADKGLEEAVFARGVVEETQPRITAADLETIQDVLGSFSTDFSSSGSARSTNLSVGAAKINGRVLMPGETLSGYECLQPFTEANGYQSAAAYENGQVVDSIGGGVCQIATTLYNAALLAELEITQRQNHSMSVGYVKPSQDAAIAGTYKDIKITNPYETPVYVEGYTKGRTLAFAIYGRETRPPNRKIAFQSETLSVTSPGAPREVPNPALAPGTRRQVQSAHKGIRSRLWKIVTVDGVEQERTLLSTDTYYASPAVIQVGPVLPPARQAPAAEVPATEPHPSPAPSPGTGTMPSDTEPSKAQVPPAEPSSAQVLPAEPSKAQVPPAEPSKAQVPSADPSAVSPSPAEPSKAPVPAPLPTLPRSGKPSPAVPSSAETQVAPQDGSKDAETWPEGRGSSPKITIYE